MPDWVVVRAKNFVRYARFYDEDVARQGVPLLIAYNPLGASGNCIDNLVVVVTLWFRGRLLLMSMSSTLGRLLSGGNG